MSPKIRRLDPGLRLNERVLAPVQRLARMAGVSPAEIIEFLLEEIFEGDVEPPAAAAAAPRARPRAAVIPITRARGFKRAGRGIDLAALRQQAEELRCRAQAARERATAARAAAAAARDKSAGDRRERPGADAIRPARAARRR